MPAILLLVQEILSLVPQMIDAGISISNLYAKTRAVLDANKLPGDADWQELDLQVRELQEQLAKDP